MPKHFLKKGFVKLPWVVKLDRGIKKAETH